MPLVAMSRDLSFWAGMNPGPFEPSPKNPVFRAKRGPRRRVSNRMATLGPGHRYASGQRTGPNSPWNAAQQDISNATAVMRRVRGRPISGTRSRRLREKPVAQIAAAWTQQPGLFRS